MEYLPDLTTILVILCFSILVTVPAVIMNARYIKKCKLLPPLGSVYTIDNPKSAFNGISGIVGHHDDGKSIYICLEGSTITNIKIK